MPLRIAIDLDGVILKYKTSKSFDRNDNRMPYGQFGVPLPGVKEALKELRAQGWEIVILTTRANRTTVWNHLKSKLKLDFDALVSPARDLAYDIHLSAGGIRFTGNWTKALSDVLKAGEAGTWEERRLRSGITKGLHEVVKGFL